MASYAMPSSPPSAGWSSVQEELAYYKSQYEWVEGELREFQESSKELEQELERDVEESEKRERKLQEKVERLGFEVEEWKAKYKQSKTEANNAQNTLQKEITSLRDVQRTLQRTLRDIEVQSDDFERQARNQTSSLEDVESKYNVSIERGVLLEEEVKIGEQEREALRIETQRLRDEFSDLRIEADIVQEKLRLAEATIERHHQRKVSSHIAGDSLRPRSPISEASTTTTTRSSRTAASTPPRSKSDALRSDSTPPSPPLSDVSLSAKPVPVTPILTRKSSLALSSGTAPRVWPYNSKPRHTRKPSVPMASRQSIGASGRSTPSIKTTAPRSTTPKATAPSQRPPRTSIGSSRASVSSSTAAPPAGMPRSGSLYQIRGLIGKMQKLEERVYSARSKLPAPPNSPPQASPRTASALGHRGASNITLRSTRKRPSQASATSSTNDASDSGVSRLSFGTPSTTRESGQSRPSSRASLSSSGMQRPPSRSGTRTMMGHYSSASMSGMDVRYTRPRSSMSGQSIGYNHSHSRSMSYRDSETDTRSDGSSVVTPVGRRSTMEKSGIPTPTGLPRRQSAARRPSHGIDGDMGPPARPRKMSTYNEEDLETY
ncbi:nuclear distribution protein-like protein nude [Dothidotthia symphoricarpi CBS 119687]|uniref:Nuclear distribution protein-like protein nude n=1 Tax=Dothidotthia symphoricarpi CBS 119687 TaxID=1392245 RepID=A0A6A6AUX6_9PLEO|nr:nuclear distribution protein-like protein nude [Dothidotthia symphoricarpi CBS 119687]KAF2134765.1 nuclear distribution protein-like protein nude [Dothidotthia symphoricarpi CBS 119687]